MVISQFVVGSVNCLIVWDVICVQNYMTALHPRCGVIIQFQHNYTSVPKSRTHHPWNYNRMISYLGCSPSVVKHHYDLKGQGDTYINPFYCLAKPNKIADMLTVFPINIHVVFLSFFFILVMLAFRIHMIYLPIFQYPKQRQVARIT